MGGRRVSPSTNTDIIVTEAIAPDVRVGCAIFSGKNFRVIMYRTNAKPYNETPNNKGQFLIASIGAARVGILKGGCNANLINKLADALEAIPARRTNHFIVL